jgi:hypothetical protein
MTFHRFCKKSSTTDATSGAGTDDSFGVPEFCFDRFILLDL